MYWRNRYNMAPSAGTQREMNVSLCRQDFGRAARPAYPVSICPLECCHSTHRSCRPPHVSWPSRELHRFPPARTYRAFLPAVADGVLAHYVAREAVSRNGP
eukprot:IDg10126t1